MKTRLPSTKMYGRAVLNLPFIALAVASSALGSHVTQGPDIAVYRDHYTAGGRAYSTLDALEAAVQATRPASVHVVACEPAAMRAWLAAVPRFDHLPMHLSVADPSSPDCLPAAIPAAVASGMPGVEEPAVRKYWEQRMP